MSKRNLTVLLLAASLLFLSLPAAAQRQTPGRPSLELYGSFGQPGFRFAGGGVFWSNYNFGGFTVLGVDVYRNDHYFHEDAVVDKTGMELAPEIDHVLPAYEVSGVAGYRFRLLAPRSRAVILSAGADLKVGVKYCEAMSRFQKSGGKAYGKVGFWLGLAPEVKLEVFPFRNVSLFVAGRPRVTALCTLGGSDGWFLLSGRGGLVYYL